MILVSESDQSRSRSTAILMDPSQNLILRMSGPSKKRVDVNGDAVNSRSNSKTASQPGTSMLLLDLDLDQNKKFKQRKSCIIVKSLQLYYFLALNYECNALRVI